MTASRKFQVGTNVYLKGSPEKVGVICKVAFVHGNTVFGMLTTEHFIYLVEVIHGKMLRREWKTEEEMERAPSQELEANLSKLKKGVKVICEWGQGTVEAIIEDPRKEEKEIRVIGSDGQYIYNKIFNEPLKAEQVTVME